MLLSSLKNKGFTLVEIMITVVLIGIIAAFAIPNYKKAVNKAHERDAINGLRMIHSAGQLYKVREDSFGITNLGASAINAKLNISLIENNVSYSWEGYDSYFIVIASVGGTFTIKITSQQSLNATNPCCNSGPCPSLPHC